LSPSSDPSINHPTNHHLAKLTSLAYISPQKLKKRGSKILATERERERERERH
jgi:hypothetical protein